MSTVGYTQEKAIENASEPVPFDTLKIIFEQIENCICRIQCPKGGVGTGFFCLIPFPNKLNLLQVLITNNHNLDKEDIEISKKIKILLNNDKSIIEINIDSQRKTYTNKNYDVTIIELKQSDGLNLNNFLEIDENIFNSIDNVKDTYTKKSIYIIYYPPGKKASYSNGIIKNISEDNFTINHLCPSVPGSSGCPLISLNEHKVIAVHKGSSSKNWNLATILKEPIENCYNEKSNMVNIQMKEKTEENLSFPHFGSINISSILIIQFCVLRNRNNFLSLFNEFPAHIKKEVEAIYKIIKKREFITLVKTDFINYNSLLNISNGGEKRKMEDLLYQILKEDNFDIINMIDITRNFRFKELNYNLLEAEEEKKLKIVIMMFLMKK